MAELPNTEYITVNKDGIFVGGKPATHYRGVEIGFPEAVKRKFQVIQSRYPNIQEMRFLTSKTSGEFLSNGNPDVENGPNGWACIKFNDGYIAPWAVISRNCPYDYIISREISYRLHFMTENYNYLHSLLGRYQDVTIRINLQNMAGKSFELNGYKISIEKAMNQRHR